MAGTKRRRRRREWRSKDFEAVLALPERLAAYLRLLLHLDKATWDFCCDKARQHLQWAAEPKRPECVVVIGGEQRRSRSGPVYFEWAKSKGPGKGWRRFAAPCNELRVVQRAILDRLLSAIPVHFSRHGGQRGSSIVTNARQHLGATSVFAVDLMHAFPTVTRARVRANLRKPLAFALRQFAGVTFSAAGAELRNRVGKTKDDDARDKVLAELMQHDVDAIVEALCDLLVLRDRLPQGPPTSPRILDLVCMTMDQAIWSLCSQGSSVFQRFTYTAYADDLTISSADGEIPEDLREAILEAIRAHGFAPHMREDKTKYYSPATGEVAVVTGIVIGRDRRLTMAPRKANQLRSRLHRYLARAGWDESDIGVVVGTLGYIRHLYPEKLPSKLRTPVTHARARLEAIRAAKGQTHAQVTRAKRGADLTVPLPPDIAPEVVRAVVPPVDSERGKPEDEGRASKSKGKKSAKGGSPARGGHGASGGKGKKR